MQLEQRGMIKTAEINHLLPFLKLNGLVQDGHKRLFWVKIFSFKSAWIFACAFRFSRKTFPCIFFGWNALVPLCCVHCAHFNMLSLFFSETKCKPAKKNTGECFTINFIIIEKHMQKFRHFWTKKNLPDKVTYVHLAPSHSIVIGVFTEMDNAKSLTSY